MVNDVRLGLWPAGAPVSREMYEAWRQREGELERVMQTVPAAAVERYEAMSYAEVCRRATAVEVTLAAVAREHGGAASVMGSEEDDWLKLCLEMKLDDCRTVAEMPFGRGARWALRLAAHAASRGDRAPAHGVVPSEGMQCVRLTFFCGAGASGSCFAGRITRWGVWSWGIRLSGSSLLDRDAVVAVASQVQNLATSSSHRAWPFKSP